MQRLWRSTLIALGALLIILLVGPFLVPVPPLDTVPPSELADSDSRFVTVSVRGMDVAVHYKIIGDGEPTLVLIHGFASSTFTWREVMEPLAERYTVIALDWMPYGLTERPLPGQWPDGSLYSQEAQVELVVGLMDALGVERAILVGNSAGGALAAQIAHQHPERVQALVLIAPAIFLRTEEVSQHSRGVFSLLSSPVIRNLGQSPQMRRLGPLLVRNIRDWGIEFGRSAWHDPDRITDDIWAGYLLPLQSDNWDRGLYEAVIANDSTASDLSNQLDALTLPTLVVTGDDDRIVPTDSSIRLAEALPNAELIVLEACGHVPQEECADPFLVAVFDFLIGLETESY